MIDIPKNNPGANAAPTAASDVDRHVKRVLDSFKAGRASVMLGAGANGISERDAKTVGRLFVEKEYFASLVYSVDGGFRGLNVSTSRLYPYATSAEVAGVCKPIAQDERLDDTWTKYPDSESFVDPDLFSFNGELVTVVSDASKPYAIYRRCYPHRPKFIVADRSHRVLCLCVSRCHAQTVVDELNALAAK